MADERLHIEISGDARSAERATERAERSTKDLRREVDKTSASYLKNESALAGVQKQAKSTSREQDRLAASSDDTRRSLGGLNREVSNSNRNFQFLRNTIRLVKFPALITGAGLATQGLSALGAAAVALTSALAPLTGALVAYPALLGALGQAAGVVALAGVKDLTEAMAGNEEALKRLTPEAKRFLDTLKGYGPQFTRLKAQTQGSLFGGAAEGVENAMRNFGALRTVLRATAGSMALLAREAGRFLGRSGFGRDFVKIGLGNARVLRMLGIAGLNLADALRHVMVEAQPLIRWMSNGIVSFSAFVKEQAKAGRESGRLAEFFGQTRRVMERLTSIGGSLASVFMEIGHAAAPLGRDILRSLDRGADSLERWAESTRGRHDLRDYFASAKPAIFESGRLIADIGREFFRLADTPGLTQLIRKFRVELLPVLVDMTRQTTKAFGPVLVDFLVQATKLLSNFVGNAGPLNVFVRLLTEALKVFNALFRSSPFVKDMTVAFVSLAAVVKTLKFAAAITGVTALINLFGRLRTAATGATAASGGMFAIDAARARAAGATAAGAFAGGWKTSLLKGGLITAAVAILVQGISEVSATIRGEGARWASDLGSSITEAMGPRVQKAVDEKFIPALNEMRRGFRATVAYIRDQGQEIPENLRQQLNRVNQALARSKEAMRDIQPQIRQLRVTFADNLGEIRKRTESNMRQIERSFGTHSKQGKELLQRNYLAAVDAIRKAMRQGVIETDKGHKAIEKITRKQLKKFGLSEDLITRHEAVTEKGHKGGLRHGGAVVPGTGTGDKVPLTLGGVPAAMVEPGEGVYVVNRNAQQALEAANTAVPRFAQGGALPGLQAGGLQAGITALVKWAGKTLGLNVSSGLRPGDSDSFHGSGEAADFVPPSMRATTSIFSHWKDQLAELFYDPWGGWDSGQRIGAIGDHLDHIHAAIIGGGKGGPTAGAVKFELPRFSSDFPHFAPAAEQLNRTAVGMEREMAKRAGTAGGIGPHVGGGTLTPAEFIRVALEALRITGKFGASRANAGKLLSLAQQESGLAVGARNDWDSNAAAGMPSQGLMQVIPPTFRTYHQKGTSQNILDPLANVAASINYQAARYGHLVTDAPYARGGFIDVWGKGMAFLQEGGKAKGEQGKKGNKKESKRAKKLAKRLQKIKSLGTFGGIEEGLTAQQELADTALDYADRYSSTENVPLETKWVQAYLARIVGLRNLLVVALDRAKQALADLAKKLKASEKAIREREKQLRQMERPTKRKDEKDKDYRKRLEDWQNLREQRTRQLSNQKKLRGAIETSIGDEGSGATGSQATWADALNTLQGRGSPMGVVGLTQLASMPLGTFGGDILSAQTRLRELGRREDEGEDSGVRASLLEEALRASQARSRSLASSFDIFRGFIPEIPGLPFVGAFKSGGIIPLPRGQAGMALVHGQETVVPEGGSGGAPVVNLTLTGKAGELVELTRAEIDGYGVPAVNRRLGRSGRQRAVAPGRG
jgi:SLT domain-containing protein